MMRRIVFIGLLGFLFSFVFTQKALAQVIPPASLSRIDPGQISRELSQTPTLSKPSKGQIIRMPQARAPHFSAKAAKIKFHFNGIRITGMTIYTQAQILPLYRAYLGKTISLLDLQKVTYAITKKYHDAGYVLSRAILVPQHIRHGRVHIRVVEGYVKHVSIRGNPQTAWRLLLAYGKHIQQSRPLRFPVLERNVLLANDIPGIEVRSVLEPSKTVGAADLTFIVTPKRFSGYVSTDNRGTEFYGRQQYRAGLTVYNLLGGDSTSVNGVITNKHRLWFVQADHDQLVGHHGQRVWVSYERTNTEPAASLADFNIKGVNTTARGEFSFPVIRSRKKNLYLSLGFNYINSQSDMVDANLYNDRIRTVTLQSSFDLLDNLYGVNTLVFGGTQGMDVLDASQAGDTDLSRADGKPDFTKLNLTVSRLQYLPKQFSIFIAASGQYAFQPLLSSEQFAFGGSSYGYAFDPAEIIGDRGVEGKIEFRYTPTWSALPMKSLQLYTFYDIGKVWNISSVDQPAKASASSAGVGSRILFNKYLFLTLQWAKPIMVSADVDQGYGSRFFFSAGAQF